MNKILVTGANGFIGQSLCNKLIKKNKIVRGIVRDESIAKNNLNIEYASVGDINSETNWMHLLSNIDCIIHYTCKSIYMLLTVFCILIHACKVSTRFWKCT